MRSNQFEGDFILIAKKIERHFIISTKPHFVARCIAVDHEIRVKLHAIILIGDCTKEREKNKSASWECCQFKKLTEQ
jgi:hypothetical protein